METTWEILVASPDLEMRRSIVTILTRLGVDAICASTVEQCREVLAKNYVGLVFSDRHFPDGTYLDLLAPAGSTPGEKPRIVLTTYCIDPAEYHTARLSGVFEVISSPCHSTAVEWMVIQAMRDDRKRRRQDPVIQPANVARMAKAKAAAAFAGKI